MNEFLEENKDDMKMSRRWMFTINNEEKTDNDLKNYIEGLEHFKYCAFQREKGEEKGTEHIQGFIIFTVGKRFSTIKKYFPRAHIEKTRGTNVQARDYCTKSETRISGPFEFGEFAEERARTDIRNLIGMVDAGATNAEIKQLFPNAYLKYLDKIEKVRQENLYQQFAEKIRKLDVTYIYGKAGVGKTSYVFKNHKYNEVFRLTNYGRNCFDAYQGQKVIVFDEFDSSFKLTEFLNYLDIYPLWLPCRYADKVACYDKVYIISNLPLKEQYKNIQNEKPEQFKALLRRIHKVIEMQSGSIPKLIQDCSHFQQSLEGMFEEIVLENGLIPF